MCTVIHQACVTIATAPTTVSKFVDMARLVGLFKLQLLEIADSSQLYQAMTICALKIDWIPLYARMPRGQRPGYSIRDENTHKK